MGDSVPDNPFLDLGELKHNVLAREALVDTAVHTSLLPRARLCLWVQVNLVQL